MRRSTFPEHGIAHGPNAEIGKPIDVVKATTVAGPHKLIEVPVSHAIDGTFDSSPYLRARRGQLPHRSLRRNPGLEPG
jgi:hypothetical protein